MGEVSELLDRAIPDRTATEGLGVVEAAEVDFLAGRPKDWIQLRPDVHPAVRARALVLAGDGPGARAALKGLAEAPASPQATAAAVWAASRVGLGEVGPVLRAQVEALPTGFVLDEGVPLGTGALLSGLLAIAVGDLDEARRDLTAAVTQGDQRAPVWGARARLELARVLRTVEAAVDQPTSIAASKPAPGANDGSRRALTSAEAFFAAGGYHHLVGQVRAVSEVAPIHDLSEPTLGHLVAGQKWQVGFGVQPWTSMTARKGLLALQHLIEHRHRNVPAVELVAVLNGANFDQSALAAVDELARGKPLEEADLSAALRRLLLDDRARSRVSKLLRRTIASLAADHPALSEHLDVTVRTGYACRYEACASTVWRT